MYRGVFQSTSSAKKMRELVQNIEKQLKHKRTLLRANVIQIYDFKKMIISLSVNPKNCKVEGDLMIKKDNEIKVLKKKLNIL